MPNRAHAGDATDTREIRNLDGVFALLRETLHTLPASAVIATIAVNITGLILPLVTIQIYDRLIPQQAMQTLTLLALCVAAVITFEALLKIARSQVVFWLATQNAWWAYGDALGRILAAPRDWLIKHGPSHILDHMRAQQAVAEWHGSPSRLVLVDVPFVGLFIGLMAVVGGWMALVPTLLFACLGFLLMRRSRDLQNAARARAQEDMRVQEFLIESILGLPQIKGAAMEPQMCRRFERLQGAAAYWSCEATRISEEARGHSDLLASLTQIVTLAIGAIAVCTESMTAGTLAGCTMLAGRAVQPALRFMSMWNEIQALSVERDKARPIWELPPSLPAPLPDRAPGAVAFELQAVSLAAQAGVKPDLTDADLKVEAGSLVSILGTHGPGSSPLTALLTGRLKAEAGHVTIDGKCPTAEDAALRGMVIAVLPTQKPLAGTLIESLAMFRDADGQSAARDAARLIGLDAEILQLPQGYETRIGDTLSSELSESLLQMVAIARAVALRPGLLILDEVNDALDNRHSRMLERALPVLAKHMTIVPLTNRPSFAAVAGHRLCIEEGKFRLRDDGDSNHAPVQRDVLVGSA